MSSNVRDRLLVSFAEHRDALMRFLVRRVGNPALAEDLAQETWLRAATASGVQAVDNPRSYLFRIAANLAVDHHRHQGLGVEMAATATMVERVFDPAPSPETAATYSLELARLLRAVDAMPPRRRQVFLLVKVEGMSYAEAAARLGIAKNTVMVQMTKALAWLDRHFEPDIGGG